MTPPNLPPEWREAFEERAAIREYDGGLPRDEAERLALADVRAVMRRVDARAGTAADRSGSAIGVIR